MKGRLDYLHEYQAGVRSMDPEKAMAAAAPQFEFIDGALESVITRETLSN